MKKWIRASEVRVGDMVEFEPGSPVYVVAIELNHGDAEDPHPFLLTHYGRSLFFSCAYDKGVDAIQTFYVRREGSVVDERFAVR